MPDVTFSVVIPCHNGADTVLEALASVRAQVHPASEIIVVDDGSTDGTSRLIEQTFPMVHCLRQEQMGAAAARNAGSAIAASDFVAFLDADDRWRPDHLAALARAAKRFPQASFLGTRAPRRGAPMDAERRKPRSGRHRAPELVDFFAASRRNRVKGPVHMSSVAFARSVFHSQGERFPATILAEDIAFFCRVSRFSDLAWVRIETIVIRNRSTSVTSSIVVEEDRQDCDAYANAAHYRAASSVASDPSVSRARQRSARLYRDDLLARHWITVIANRHQTCAIRALPSLETNWSIQAVMFRIAARLPQPVALVLAPIARSVLRWSALPTHSPFHARTVTYPRPSALGDAGGSGGSGGSDRWAESPRRAPEPATQGEDDAHPERPAEHSRQHRFEDDSDGSFGTPQQQQPDGGGQPTLLA